MAVPVGSSSPLTPIEYARQLEALIPTTDEACKKLNKEDKAARINAINKILREVFESRSQFNQEQFKDLRKLCTLSERAARMKLVSGRHIDFVSKIAASTAQIAPLDLTISAKKDKTQVDIPINKEILREKSEVFGTMLSTELGFKEAKEMKVALEGYSKEAVELLGKCLYAAFSTDIQLPHDQAVVLELIDLAVKYRFNELLSKLEPAVMDFIQQHPEEIVDNAEAAEAWLKFLLPLTANTGATLHPEEAAKGEIAAKWISEMTPHLLQAVGIPSSPSTIPGKYEIFADRAHAFFNEDTRDLLQHLPVVLTIKDEMEFQALKTACNEAKASHSLSIKVYSFLSAQQEIVELAKAKNVSLEFLNPLPPGTTFFGEDLWIKLLGDPGKVPPIPADKIKALSEPCPYNPGKTTKETHMLVLWPATVNGKPLNIIHLRELVKNGKGGGHKTDYRYIYDKILNGEHGKSSLKESRWVLMTMDVIPESRNKKLEQQKALVEKAPHYKVPSPLGAAVCILTHFVHTGVRLFSDDPYTYTRCEETVDGYPIVVGGFAPAGLYITITTPSTTTTTAWRPCGSSFRSLVLGPLVLEKRHWPFGHWSLVQKLFRN